MTEYETAIVDDLYLWDKEKCLRTHFWDWLTLRWYSCPVCRWGEVKHFSDSWLGGTKPVGAP
jgi:hypothetical protein